jgi:hypothetical protein
MQRLTLIPVVCSPVSIEVGDDGMIKNADEVYRKGMAKFLGLSPPLDA